MITARCVGCRRRFSAKPGTVIYGEDGFLSVCPECVPKIELDYRKAHAARVYDEAPAMAEPEEE
jgi:hypothetical protein